MAIHLWAAFAAKHPKPAKLVLALGADLYAKGADEARNHPALERLVRVLRTLPPDSLALLGLGPQFSRGEALVAVFRLGGPLLLDIEHGKRF